eukprot:g3955.t1
MWAREPRVGLLVTCIAASALLCRGRAQSATCAAVAKSCEAKLTSLDQSTAAAHAMNFCPFLKNIYHSKTEGCMGSPEAQCCCCEKEDFVDPLNTLMKETEELKMLWGFNPSCKDAPLQCDPNIDCEACQGGKKCEQNPTESELKGIDLAKTNCENTESASTCDDFACKASYVKEGSATCMNGKWDLTVQIITKEEIEAGRIKPKCMDADQRYSLENHELTALPGYWKATPESSDFMDCSIAFQGGASIGKVFGGVFVVLAVLFFALVYKFLKADEPKDGKKKKMKFRCCKKKSKKGETKKDKSDKKHIEIHREKDATNRFLADQALAGRVQGSGLSGLKSASHSGEVMQMDYSIEVGGARHANVTIVIVAGIILYVVIALLIVLVNMLLVLKLAPFADEADDWLSFLTSFQMMITLLGGLMMVMDNTQIESRGVTDPGTMGSLLVFVNLIGFFAFALSLALLHPSVRNRVNRCFAHDGETKSDNLTKVKPDGDAKSKREAPLPEPRRQRKSDPSQLKALREWN